MIEIRSFSFSYGAFTAVADLDLSVRDGEIVGLLGPNGAGKTTTIKSLVGLLRPHPEHVFIGACDMAISAADAKRSIAYVPDKPHLYELLSAWEYLEFVAGLWDLPAGGEWRIRAEKELKRFDLYDVRDNLLESYSQGMRQKVLLISGLIHEPKVWVLDEPMSGLDPRAARMVRDILRTEADRGAAVLLSTHTLDIAERMCDRICILDKGRKIAEGTMAELRKGGQERLEDLFLRLTEATDESGAVLGL